MTTDKPYTPKADSLAASVVHFFHGNPDEELTLDDISDKFDAGRNNIHTQLARAVEAGLLARGTNEDGEYIYTAGKAINATKAGADLTTALAKLLNLGKVAPVAAVVDLARETPDPACLHLLILMQSASGANDYAYNGTDRVANEGLMLVAGNVFGDQLQTVIDEIKAECKARIWPEPAAKKPPTTDTPAAPAGEGAGGKKPKGKPERAAARAKVSAEEAQLGIAAAMQGMEGAASADAVAPPAEPGGEAGGLRVGARVKILPSATGKKEARWIGKTGTVQRQIGPQAWDVCFTAKVARPITGKNVGEFQSFHVTEMEVEEA